MPAFRPRDSVGRLSSVLQGIFPAPRKRSVLGEELAEKVKWLIKLRWAAIAAQLFCIAPGLLFELLQPSDLPLYFGIVVCLVVFNLIAPRFVRCFVLDGEWHLFGHLAVDLAALGALLAISNGCHNPLAALIYLNTGWAKSWWKNPPATVIWTAPQWRR